MKCPIKAGEGGILLEFAAGRLDSTAAAGIERHLGACEECRRFVAGQRAVWESLDLWTAPPVSPGFDRRLYERIAEPAGWWERVRGPLGRPRAVRGGLIAATACATLIAGLLLEHPGRKTRMPQPQPARVQSVEPEQVEHALDDLDMLGQFNGAVRGETAPPAL